jgi:O-antigen/teichoic acid export membrane protein
VTLFRQHIKNIAALIGQSTIQRLLGIFSTILLARLLGLFSFGAYSAIINTANSAYGMVRLGIDASIHVHTAESNQREDAYQDKGNMLGVGLLLLLISGLLGMAACLLLSDWLAKSVYGQTQLSHWMIFAAGLVLVQCVTQFLFATLAGMHEFKSYSWAMVLSAIFSFFATSVGAYIFGINGALSGMFLTQIFSVFLLVRLVRNSLHANKIILRLGSFKKWAYRLLSLGFPFYVAGLISVPITLYLQGMLSRQSGLEALGELRVIISILSLISFIPTAASSAMISLLTRSSTNDYFSFIQQALLHIKYIWLFAVFSGLGVFMILPFTVNLIFGETYMGVVTPASYAILTTIITCIIGFANNILFARRRVKLILAHTVFQMVAFVVVASTLIPKIGLIGYCAAELCGSFIAILFILFKTISWKKRHSVDIPWLLPVILLSIIDGLVLLILSYVHAEEYRILCGVLLITFSIFIVYHFVLTKQDRDLLINFFH